MRAGPYGTLLFLGVILMAPLAIIVIAGQADRNDQMLALFVFYPISAFCLYYSLLHLFWIGIKLDGENVILRKGGIWPIKLILRRSAIDKVKITTKTFRSEDGPYAFCKVLILTKLGESIQLGEFSGISDAMMATLRKAPLPSADAGCTARNEPEMRRTTAYLPLAAELSILAVGIILYCHLCLRGT